MMVRKIEEILDERLKELKDDFLHPLREAVASLRDTVAKNKEEIAEGKAAINKSLKMTMEEIMLLIIQTK